MGEAVGGASNGLSWPMQVNPSSSDSGPSLRELVRDILEDLFAEYFFEYLVEAVFNAVGAFIAAVLGFLSAVVSAIGIAVTSALSPLVTAGRWFADGLAATQASVTTMLEAMGLAAPFAVAAGWAATIIFMIVLANFVYALLSTLPIVSTATVTARSVAGQMVVLARSALSAVIPGGNDNDG